jgi:hypothetical protein
VCAILGKRVFPVRHGGEKFRPKINKAAQVFQLSRIDRLCARLLLAVKDRLYHTLHGVQVVFSVAHYRWHLDEAIKHVYHIKDRLPVCLRCLPFSDLLNRKARRGNAGILIICRQL